MGGCPADLSEGLCSQKQDCNLKERAWEVLMLLCGNLNPSSGVCLQNKRIVSDGDELPCVPSVSS